MIAPWPARNLNSYALPCRHRDGCASGATCPSKTVEGRGGPHRASTWFPDIKAVGVSALISERSTSPAIISAASARMAHPNPTCSISGSTTSGRSPGSIASGHTPRDATRRSPTLAKARLVKRFGRRNTE
jgi:hypothetical protein